jgi:hypothetical protein
MIKLGLLANQKKPDALSDRRRVDILKPEVKPLPTLPPIVGDQRYSDAVFPNPGTDFFKRRLMTVRRFTAIPAKVMAEPNNNSPNTY